MTICSQFRLPVILLVLSLAPAAFSQVPRTLSYQGALTDQGGGAVPDGSYSVTFRLYTAASGGTAVWTEGQTVQVSGGILSAVLGSVTPIGEAVTFSQPYWLGIQVAPGSELAPRVPLTSVGYSLRSAVADAASGFTVPMALSGTTAGAESLLSLLNTGTGHGLTSTVSSSAAGVIAVRGLIANSTTGSTSVAVRGENWSTGGSGMGIWGSQQGSGWGVYGTSINGRGLYGLATALSGETYGVVGRSDSNNGRGVFGFAPASTGTTYGVLASSASTGGRGVFGLASATTGNTYGIHGRSESSGGRGIVGEAPNASGSTIGVYGVVVSPAGRGVYGYAAATSGSAYGVHGRTDAPTGRAVFGHATAVSGTGNGVWGQSDSPNGRGVYGFSASGFGVVGQSTSRAGVVGNSTNGAGVSGNSGSGYGVEAVSNNVGVASAALFARNPIAGTTARLSFMDGSVPFAAAFSGRVWVSGPLEASTLNIIGSKHFRIDHPLDPENSYLHHAAIESNEVLNFYNGNITTDANGSANVNLPDYFGALNIDYRYQLTVVGEFAQAIISREIQNNNFEIRTDRPNVRVSWQVTGVRNDPYMRANPMVVEQEKTAAERGRYLSPELYGAPPEQGLNYFPPSPSEFIPPDRDAAEGLSDLESENARLAEESVRLEAETRALREELHRLETERRVLEDN